MSQGYQNRDQDVVDYELHCLSDIDRPLRGPAPRHLNPGDYFTVVGAAQTFGCFCERPYPNILSEEIGLPVLNFGIAGAGPLFFVKRAPFIERINASRFVILQVMSGRSESNSIFESDGGEILKRRSDGKLFGAAPAYQGLLESGNFPQIDKVVSETRENWVRNYLTLVAKIRVPKILFWFSERDQDYEMSYSTVHGLFGKFPQLVTRNMVEQIQTQCEYFLKCVSSRGLPQPLISRFTGKPTSFRQRQDLGGKVQTHNTYYPSPEMHLEAAAILRPACMQLLGRPEDVAP